MSHEVAIAFLRDAWHQQDIQATSGQGWVTQAEERMAEARLHVAQAIAKRDAIGLAIAELEKQAV